MKAVTYRRYGGPEVLEYRDVDPPTAGHGEVPVRVHATAINAADYIIDYTTTDFVAQGRPYDIIVGANGHHSLGDYKRCLTTHRPDSESARRSRTTRSSTAGPTWCHTDTARRTCSSRYASGRRQ